MPENSPPTSSNSPEHPEHSDQSVPPQHMEHSEQAMPPEQPEQPAASEPLAALINYQDALLELLSSGLPQGTIVEALKTDPRFTQYEDYIAQFDPDMVAVACELMGKWAKRKPNESRLHRTD